MYMRLVKETELLKKKKKSGRSIVNPLQAYYIIRYVYQTWQKEQPAVRF